MALLNYLKYREMRNEDERRIQVREADRRHRQKVTQRKPDKAGINHRKPLKAPCKAEAEAEAVQKQRRSIFPKRPTTSIGSGTAYPNKKAKGDARKAWTQTKGTGHHRRLVAKVETLKHSRQWTQERGRYIPYPATWLAPRAGKMSRNPPPRPQQRTP